jgi:3-hydroxyacyl-[acyl-carrier-protein] dehydratase
VADPIIDVTKIDLNRVLYYHDEIRKFNPQRYEMEHLDAVVFVDEDREICVGYKDLRPDEFWARGHMPGCAALPGTIMCEAVAQLASFFVAKYDLLGYPLIGLGGMHDVQISRFLVPGQRLVIAMEKTRVRHGALILCRFQGFVEHALAIEGRIKGVPLPDT